MLIVDFPSSIQFDWDAANKNKIWEKHKVSVQECEEAFFTSYIFTQPDKLHSGKENRHILISKTKKSRYLFLVYTIRKNKVRVISARDMHKKEQLFYEEEAKNS